MKLSGKILALYFILLSAFTLLIISVFLIPTSCIRDNVAESAKQIQKEGLWFQPFGFYLFQIDNMTDCLMMNISVCADTSHPVKAAMMAENAQPYENGDTRLYKNIDETTLSAAVNGLGGEWTNKRCYPRYWHGYQVVLRPLLCFFSHDRIIMLNYLALSVLFIAVIVMLYKRLGPVYSMTFPAVLMISGIMIVPLAIQFSTCFYISMLCMLLFLVRPQLAGNMEKSVMVFFTTGAVTSYMDFLTTPLLTLGFPLVVTTAMYVKRRNKTKTILWQSLAWLGGYASLWASKWVIAWMLTGENVIGDAIDTARLRVGNTIVFGGSEMHMDRFFDIITTKISSIVNPLLILFIIFAVTAAAAAYFYVKRRHIKNHAWLFFIAAMPLMWFMVMKNHSLQHIFFTWRDWILTFWCLAILICHTRKTCNIT